MVEKDIPKTREKRMIDGGNTKRYIQSQKGISPSVRDASGCVEGQAESGISFSHPFSYEMRSPIINQARGKETGSRRLEETAQGLT